MGVNTMITEADDNADTLVAERDAMKDSLRWRKQSEEKAPAEQRIICRAGTYTGFVFGRELEPGDEWLPVPP